ncbi:hypothetical protein [Frankia sp. R43]|uniref:hypothetical protein n=1 Tax=Frankia sp. R43 TaxID=269536 RepID=UPI0006CA1501|nr:hypothetical protein [Frankia sp. R43]
MTSIASGGHREADLDVELMLAEYQALKAEQLARIGTRDNLLYATLAAYAAIVAGVLGGGGPVHIMLALPAVAAVLGWTYLANDKKIVQIREYLRRDLGGRIGQRLPDGATAFGWESTRRTGIERRLGKIGHVAVDLIAFSAASIAALAAYWTLAPIGALTVLAVAESGVTLAFTAEVVRWSLSGRASGWRRSE